MVFEESVKLKVTRRSHDRRNILAYEVTGKNHHKAEANCPVRAEAGNWRLDGCRDSND